MVDQFPRGAEWRKWDLHFHTPSSYDYENKSMTDEEIVNLLISNNISVVAITDHHFMDVRRIEKLKELSQDQGITIFPGVEFLADTRGSEPIHFIGIFPEDCDIGNIWGQIENRTNIRRIKLEGKKEFEVYCPIKETTEIIHELGGLVTIHAGRKHASIENITNSLPHSMAQKEDIAIAVDFFELGKAEDREGYLSIVFPAIGKRLPLIICSDNHDGKKYTVKGTCWIKADPTFDGLRQIVNEPKDRVHIGKTPPLFDRVKNNRTKFIQRLNINQKSDYNERCGIWFKNQSIELNYELVAVIGNKGSGKSAIADILALCGNYRSDENCFSFLTPSKFNKNRLSENFSANLVWEGKEGPEINLGQTKTQDLLKDVKYIPQGEFERLTNEIQTAEEFQREIESVVFSHIPESERLGKTSFNEFILEMTHTVSKDEETLKEDIRGINKKIIALEEKTTQSYTAEINNRIKRKEEELEALIEPPIVSNPNEDPIKRVENEYVNKKIEDLKAIQSVINADIALAEEVKKDTLEVLQKLKRIKAEVLRKKDELDRFIGDIKTDLKEFDLNFDSLFAFKINLTDLERFISEKEKVLIINKKLLGEDASDDETSLLEKLEENQKLLDIEKSKLDMEQQRYQAYLSEKEIWEKLKAEIKGSDEKFDTLEYYKKEKVYITDKLHTDLNTQYSHRLNVTKEIFLNKKKIINIYKDVRNRLEEVISTNQETLKDYHITVDASLVRRTDLLQTFLNFVNQKRSGSFYSKDGGESQFNELVSGVNFDSFESVSEFLCNIIEALHSDLRSPEKREQRVISDQVKNIEGLYEYLFTLGFLENNYKLKQGDKELYELSPGERGALLLVFYLLLDKNDCPLIIDQPEDNLDNNSIAKILVPFIKEAKKKRQIIMVTHNPNLAVVADAEQVIYVQLDKAENYTFSTISGSIENPLVNRKIVDVLEGEMPAFNNRKMKYYN